MFKYDVSESGEQGRELYKCGGGIEEAIAVCRRYLTEQVAVMGPV